MNRKPLLLAGARQVGKTSSVKKFGSENYKNVFELNFMRDKVKLSSIFDDGLKPSSILENAQIALGKPFNQETDLLVFEEVGFSQDALTSLKFFYEDTPDIHVIATGSNIGLFKNYPVGKTERITMYPMTFREFLIATNNSMLLRFVDTPDHSKVPTVAHEKLIDLITDYWFVGGMPEAVSAWISYPDIEPLKRINAVEKVKANLLADYKNDFGKFSKEHPATALNIRRVYEAAANKIADIEDGNTPKFKFKGVLGNTSVSYEDIVAPVDFLECLKLLHKVFILDGLNNSFNMNFQKKDNMFKLVPHDVGILTSMIGMTYQNIKEGKDAYKGFIAETFVLNEIVSSMVFPDEENELFSFKRGDSMEIEFLLKSLDNEYVPIEVKSGKNKRSISLANFIEKYKPQKALKFTFNYVENNPKRILQHLPVYKARATYAKHFKSKDNIEFK
ncbi:ATP-binding protein [Glaciecola siphonariae]|uniref:ATP-binding protein n=1 Tax=Glaciecola siphonariae TaxID=521012 RepID=A0ABV9M036_9ALTE